MNTAEMEHNLQQALRRQVKVVETRERRLVVHVPILDPSSIKQIEATTKSNWIWATKSAEPGYVIAAYFHREVKE